MTTSDLPTAVPHQYHARVSPGNEAPDVLSSEPLRILHVAPYYEEAWAYGGIPRVVSSLARGLARRGHGVSVCTTDVRDAERRVPRGHTAAPVEVDVFPNVSNALAYHLQLFLPIGMHSHLARKIGVGAYDVAHLHACHNVPGVIAAHHLRAAGIPYVLQPHGTAPLIERRRTLKWVFDHTVGRQVMRDAVALITVSGAERRQLVSLGIKSERIHEVSNPLDIEEHEAPIAQGAFRQKWSLGSGPTVLYLGKLTPRKRLDVLIRSFAELGPSGGHLVIAGNDMGVRSHLEELVGQLGLRGRVVFTGLLQGRERLEALFDAEVLVYPGEHEIFGLVPLEALLQGTPVVVADDSGCGEVIGEIGGGLVVRQGDVAGFAQALRSILGDGPRWRKEAAEAARRVRDRYAPDVICARLERIYRQVVKQARGGVAGDRARL